jgi:hypothetical protein
VTWETNAAGIRRCSLILYKPDDCAFWLSGPDTELLRHGVASMLAHARTEDKPRWKVILRTIEVAQAGDDRRFGEAEAKALGLG